jgi:hypothetical protein
MDLPGSVGISRGVPQIEELPIVPLMPKRRIQGNWRIIRAEIEQRGWCSADMNLPGRIKAGDFALQYYYMQYKKHLHNKQRKGHHGTHDTYGTDGAHSERHSERV